MEAAGEAILSRLRRVYMQAWAEQACSEGGAGGKGGGKGEAAGEAELEVDEEGWTMLMLQFHRLQGSPAPGPGGLSSSVHTAIVGDPDTQASLALTLILLKDPECLTRPRIGPVGGIHSPTAVQGAAAVPTLYRPAADCLGCPPVAMEVPCPR